MGWFEYSKVYRTFMGQCAQCGHCTPSCDSLTAAGMTLGEIAKALLAAERGAESQEEVIRRILDNPQLIQAVRGCFFCTTCKNVCFAHNDVCDLIYHARVDFQNLGLIPRDTWSSVLVDEEWDIFKAYRAIYGIEYSDLIRHIENDCVENGGAASDGAASDGVNSGGVENGGMRNSQAYFDTVFFPGCSLAAYAPELTREIFETIEAFNEKVTMIDHCCGSSLKSAGFLDRAVALCERNVDEIVRSGAKRLICVCPGCANDMRTALQRKGVKIRIQSLSSYLLEKGFKPKKTLPDVPLCLSKSCQDCDGTYLQETRKLLRIPEKTPKIFHGCCGAGGAVGAFNPDMQLAQTDFKLSHVSSGSCVITMCPTCTFTYAYHLINAPKKIINKHYTELLFENSFNWSTVFYQLSSMWSGEYASWLAEVFS